MATILAPNATSIEVEFFDHTKWYIGRARYAEFMNLIKLFNHDHFDTHAPSVLAEPFSEAVGETPVLKREAETEGEDVVEEEAEAEAFGQPRVKKQKKSSQQ